MERGFVMRVSKTPFFERRRKNTFTRQAFAYRMSVIDVERHVRGSFSWSFGGEGLRKIARYGEGAIDTVSAEPGIDRKVISLSRGGILAQHVQGERPHIRRVDQPVYAALIIGQSVEIASL